MGHNIVTFIQKLKQVGNQVSKFVYSNYTLLILPITKILDI